VVVGSTSARVHSARRQFRRGQFGAPALPKVPALVARRPERHSDARRGRAVDPAATTHATARNLDRGIGPTRRKAPQLRPLHCRPVPFFLGTFFPARRASESPMAIACLRLFTFRPERPLLSVPRFISCMARLTLRPLALLYFLAIGVAPANEQPSGS
jgi:hypothetical protein